MTAISQSRFLVPTDQHNTMWAGKTVQLLGHAHNTQTLPTYVKPLDENTKAVIEALDAARAKQTTATRTIQ